MRQTEKRKALYRNSVESCSTPLPIQDGASIRSSGTQCKSPEMKSGWIFGRYDVLVFLQQFLWTAFTDSIVFLGETANPSTAWFLGVATAWVFPGGSDLLYTMSQPHNCCVWPIETCDAICSPQAGLLHTYCPFSVDDGEALGNYSLLEWSASAMSSLQMITYVQIFGLIKPHKGKCPILRQFHEGYVIYVWQFRCGH